MSALDAIYARQSVLKADSLSISGQIDLCRRETGTEVKIYRDKGYSGKNTNRPAFQQLMEDVEAGLIQKIVVYRLDRFSRSISDFGRLWEILKAHNVEFVSINETFDTSTPMGRAMLNIIMVFAQLERETTAERVRDNYYQRAKLGSWPGGPAPYGFSIGKLPGPDGKLSPGLLPGECTAIVERIFNAYSQPDATLGSVARSLNADHIPAPKRPTWDNVTLSRILHSPLYVMADEDVYLYYKAKGLIFANNLDEFDGLHAGMIVGKRNRSVGKYQDLKDQHFSLANHYGLIPSDLWLSCQYKLDANRQLGGKGRGKHTWLSGLMKCGACGYSVKVNRDKDKYYLVCSGRSNLGLCGQSIRIDLRALEASIARELERILSECPDVDTAQQADSDITGALAAIDQKIERLMSALSESSDLTMAYINRTIERLDEQRQALLAKQSQRYDRPHLSRLKFAPLEFDQKKIVAAQFINEVRLENDTATVIWKV
ncbi:recombinase family protein [Intestinimonas massiliensis (ex Afouda et al. 2020)]|uniref:Recombinase family protein n=1 Tax=Intestinimonas massiliensis (ex Afouda et al. 2020) TaxID=1673721 RepID=A0ABS9M7G0_9FIRM|nr:recombinase family protein [Intestinimonas massiliensis (ex Afouda et al. 2020)]